MAGQPEEKQFNVQEAYDYYKQHIYRESRFALLKEYNLPISGSVPSRDWELFGAILTGDKGKRGYGCDLSSHEVKSAVAGGSFEYQYHLRGGLEKLDEDKTVGHIFVSYSPDYKDVTVRFVSGTNLADTFEGWRDGLVKNYSGEIRKQRYRKSIGFAAVVASGKIIMQIRDGKLVR